MKNEIVVYQPDKTLRLEVKLVRRAVGASLRMGSIRVSRDGRTQAG